MAFYTNFATEFFRTFRTTNYVEKARTSPRSKLRQQIAGEVRALSYGSKLPSKLEALPFIDWDKSPSTH